MSKFYVNDSGYPSRVSKNSENNAPPSTLFLSDVDGTLVKGSLVLGHAAWLHEKGVVNLGDSPEKWLADMKNEELITELAEAYKSSISGMTIEDIRAKEYIDEVVSSDENFYSTMNRLNKAREKGHEVVLISGSPQFLIGDFAKRFGFKGIGSTYHKTRERKLNGRVTGMFYAEAKREAIVGLKVESYERVIAFGDTASDKPLFDVAHHSVLVAPNTETLSKIDKVTEVIED